MAAFLVASCGGGGGDNAAANSPPTAQALALTGTEDTPLSGTLQGQDPDGNLLTFTVSAAANGTVSVSGNGPAFTYQPRADFFGSDQFTYSASDGRASSSAATVTIRIEPVNDVPRITVLATPSELDARTSGLISYQLTDVDGVISQVGVTQVSGQAVGNLQSSATQATFNMPDAAAVSDLVLRLTATDDGAGVASRDFPIRVFPLSISGRLRTVFGSPTAPGIHMVVTGDGYTAVEQGKLLSDARSLSDYVLDTSSISIYKPGWNVHVLQAVSNESGLDVPSEGITKDTVFDASTGCVGGIERNVCVNAFKVQSAAVAEYPAYDVLLALVNTTRYGGSGGSVAVATTLATARDVVLHELGHSFAGLADEYVDTAIAATYLPFYQESLYPNVTRLTDPLQSKWRHWFADPANVPRNAGQQGVGLFEGSYYHATGFFRPTDNSFMRSLSRTLGSVNTEAWAMAVYRVGGAVSAFSPTVATVNSSAGTPVAFSVSPLISVQSIEWSIDGAEVAGARGQRVFSCCQNLAGTHTVTVRVYDATGTIRTPSAGPSRFERTWTVSIQ